MGRIRIAGACAVLAVCMLLAAAAAEILVPGGQSIGVAVKTGGVVVIGASDVGKTPSPARLAGMRSGDVITTINGKAVTDAAQLGKLLTEGKNTVEYMRNGEKRTALIVPVNDSGALRLGAWVRDSAAGVGTMTYYDPATGAFGALGHPVTDADAGIVLPVADGSIYQNSIIGVEKGRGGRPGEIIGQFGGQEELGEVIKNNDFGIFGTAEVAAAGLYPEGIETAARDAVRPGQASIITTVDDAGPREYSCEITRIESRSTDTNRSFTIKITDDELIATTGGIVQGMSGSPIIQNGKLVGAVTHVMVDDPERGYGIFIENMLGAA
ncbi:MAG: SpoIVB peptidase [Clostridia bacterium]|nr:SpoIVB peptidase [Clostridia bacterium]